MSDLYGSDAYSPVEIARRIESVGEAKARMAALPLALLIRITQHLIALLGLQRNQLLFVRRQPLNQSLLRLLTAGRHAVVNGLVGSLRQGDLPNTDLLCGDPQNRQLAIERF